MLGSGCRLPHDDEASASYHNSPLTDSAKPPSEAAPSEDDLTEAFAHYGTGIIHEMDEEPELALQEYYESARKDPEDATLVLGVARRLLQANQLDKALSLLTYATSRPGASGAMFSYLGVVYSRLGKPDLANKANRSAIKRSPRLFLGYQNLFLNELEARRKKAALAVLDEAARVPGTGPEFLIGLAELYANYGLQVPAEKPAATSRAVAALERARRLPVAEPELRLKLADGFDLLGKDDQAAEIYSGLLNPLPDDLLLRQNVRAKLANIYLREHKPKLAAEQLGLLLKDNPTDIEAYFWLGQIASEQKNFNEAAEHFSRALLLKPDFKRAFYELARAQIFGGHTTEALSTLAKAREQFGQDFALEYLSAVAYTERKDYTNALSRFNSAEILSSAAGTNALEPEVLVEFYFDYGAACERNGRYADAEKYFNKCIELSPDFSPAMNYLGFMWADRGEKLEQAKTLIEKALKLDPKNAAYLDSMGWVLFKLHEPREALDYIHDAIRLTEEPDAVLYDHLGDIYSVLGQKDKALEAWNKSLSLAASEDVRKKVETTGK